MLGWKYFGFLAKKQIPPPDTTWRCGSLVWPRPWGRCQLSYAPKWLLNETRNSYWDHKITWITNVLIMMKINQESCGLGVHQRSYQRDTGKWTPNYVRKKTTQRLPTIHPQSSDTTHLSKLSCEQPESPAPVVAYNLRSKFRKHLHYSEQLGVPSMDESEYCWSLLSMENSISSGNDLNH